MEFASKGYFLLLLLLIPYILWYFLYRKKNAPTMRMSDTKKYQYAPKSLRVRLIHLPMVLRCICFVLIVCAMARPQTHTAWDNIQWNLRAVLPESWNKIIRSLCRSVLLYPDRNG